MTDLYTKDNLDELRERLMGFEEEYGLSVAARESIYESIENLLTGPNEHVSSFT